MKNVRRIQIIVGFLFLCILRLTPAFSNPLLWMIGCESPLAEVPQECDTGIDLSPLPVVDTGATGDTALVLEPEKKITLQLLSDDLIWEGSFDSQGQYDSYCSKTDLEYHEGEWYLTFREAESEAPETDGRIAVLKKGKKDWSRVADFSLPEMDLHESKLHVSPEGELFLNVRGAKYETGYHNPTDAPIFYRNYVSIFESEKFSSLTEIKTTDNASLDPADAPWKLSWSPFDRVGFIVSPRLSLNSDLNLPLMDAVMYTTSNGLEYELSQTISDRKTNPNLLEVAIAFLSNGDMVLVGRSRTFIGNFYTHEAWIGLSEANSKYQTIAWKPLKDSKNFHRRIIGPEVLVLEDDIILVAGRFLPANPYDKDGTNVTGLAQVTRDGLWIDLHKIESLHPNDMGYPGLKELDGKIYMSFYSANVQANNVTNPPDIRLATFSYGINDL